jgi:hypothetical protein
VKEVHGGDAVLVPIDNIFMRAAAEALEQEWGTAPVFERSGGSIPVGALFASELHAPIIFMGTGLPDDNIHAPNEKYHVPNFYHLIRQAIRFLEIVGSDPAILSRPAMPSQEAKTNGKVPAGGSGHAKVVTSGGKSGRTKAK